MSLRESTAPRVRPATSLRSLHAAGAVTVALIVALGASGLVVPVLLLVAAGAGAGYSLSGSV